MNNIQQWAWSLCLLLLICTVIQYLIPGGAMERSMRLVLGGFVILGILVPVTNLAQSGGWEFSWDTSTAASDEIEEANAMVLEQAKANVEALVAEKLQTKEIDSKNIEIKMDTDADNCITIDKAVVTIGRKSAADAEWIRETIQSAFAIQTEVVIDDG